MTTGYAVSNLDDRLLVDAGILVRTTELMEIVDIDPGTGFIDIFVINLNNNPVGIDTFDNTIVTCNHRVARIVSNNPLHPRTNQWCIGSQQWHRLTLHV